MEKYNIKEASDRTGISSDMIRHYEKLGLIHPERNNQNNYRMYSEYDLYTIILIKHYNSFNIPLKDCIKLINSPFSDYANNKLDEVINNLRFEQIKLTAKMEAAKKMKANLNDYEHKANYRILENDNIWLYSNEKIITNKLQSEKIVQHNQINSFYYRITFDEIKSGKDASNHEVGSIFNYSIPGTSDLEFIKRDKVFIKIIEAEKNKLINMSTIKIISKEIKKAGYQISGDCLIYQIFETNNKNIICLEFTVDQL